MDMIIYVLIGALFVTLAFVIWYVLYAVMRVPDHVPEYVDKPPLLYRLLRAPINIVAFYLSPFLSKTQIDQYEKAIVFAGAEYQIRPEHVIAGKMVGALVLGFIFLLLLWWAGQPIALALLAALLGFVYPDLWLKQTKQARNAHIAKNIPFFLDMITLSIESGLNLNGAIKQAVQKGPNGAVKAELEKVLRDIKTGVSRSEAIRKMGQRIDDLSIKSLTSSIIQAEKMGMNLGPILRAQAEQRRIERFLKAEKLAMEAPVKLLFPLVAFIFPCTFIVIGFPVYVMMKEAFG